MRELLGPLYELNLPFIEGALAGQVQVFERAIPAPDGTVRHALATYMPDIANGNVKGFSVHVSDVTRFKIIERELENARRTAERQASHDYLTGLPNRLHLAETIDLAITAAHRDHSIAAVMTIDFDNFKRLNDRFGHDAGDRILQELAHRLSRALRASETIVRFGGDEFIFVASGLSTWDPLLSTINRVRMIVCQPLHDKNITINPSFSAGVAVYPWHGKTATQLLHRADRALYRAKIKGRGLVTFAGAR